MSSDTIGGQRQATAGDSIADRFYPLYKYLFDDNSQLAAGVERNLKQARKTVNVELYLSRALGISVIAGAVLWLSGMAVAFGLITTGLLNVENLVSGFSIPNQSIVNLLRTIKLPASVIISGIVLGSIGFGLTFMYYIISPKMTANNRQRKIEKLMPDAVSFMYALSVGGMNQLEIIEAMAEAEETYGEISEEFQSVVKETNYFDTDYRTAIENQADETPSVVFKQFLRDMLSILNSGGDLERFLEDKKEKHLRIAKRQQETVLDTLELFGEMYMTLSLFPLLLIIVLVAMSLLGDSKTTLLFGTVYGLLPLLSVAFVVLISTVKSDEIGTGELSLETEQSTAVVQKNVIVDSGLVTEYQGQYRIFDAIRESEDTYNTLELLKAPHIFFRNNPIYIATLTVPATIAVMAIAVTSGNVPTTFNSIQENPVWPTFVYVYLTIYMNFLPLAIFYEWNQRHRYGILNDLSDTLRKLASANDTGQTLFEAMETVADSSNNRLADEFDIMYSKVQYGTNVNKALVEFNNKYSVPRLARTIKLVSKAQEASNEITEVLTTAAQASENQDELEQQRKGQARIQVVIILMTYMTLLFVMAILKTQFLETMAELVQSTGSGGGGGEFASGINVTQLSMLFFHAVTLQAIASGLIAGYMRDGKLMSGLKYSVILCTIALMVWSYVG